MNKVLKKAIILGIIGFAIGLIIGVTVYYLTGGSSSGEFSYFEFLVGGIYGALAMGGSAVYDIESWSIAKCTATHFVCTFVGLFALAIMQGWFYPGDLLFWILLVAWVFAYFIIWLIQYLIYHRKIDNLNEELKKFNKR